MEKGHMQVEYVPIEQVIPYVNNARKHGDTDTDAIVRSIEKFGFNDPIGVWKNIIVEGHGRLIAAKRLGMETVPVIRLDHLTDEERKAYTLAHNKTAELSGWDFDVLASELQELSDFDMSEFGFDMGADSDGDGQEQESSFNYQEQYGVIVMCDSEQDQEEIYNNLTAEGYTCKVVAT